MKCNERNGLSCAWRAATGPEKIPLSVADIHQVRCGIVLEAAIQLKTAKRICGMTQA